METFTDFGDQWIQNILNEIKTKQKKLRSGFFNDYSSNLKLLQSSGFVSMKNRRLRAIAYEVTKSTLYETYSIVLQIYLTKKTVFLFFHETQ